MENVKTEIMQQLEKLDGPALHIVLGFVRELAQATATGHDSQRG